MNRNIRSIGRDPSPQREQGRPVLAPREQNPLLVPRSLNTETGLIACR
jgi:hypothetical protein